MSDLIHLDTGDPDDKPDSDPEIIQGSHLVLDLYQAVIVCFTREDVYIAGEIAGMDNVGLLVSCYWMTESGIKHTQDSYVPWTSIESVDLCDSIDEAVKVAWTLLSSV